MAVFRQWVKNYFDALVDPDKGAEVAELTQLLNDGIVRRKQAFVLADVVGNRKYKPQHLDQAKVNVYQKYLARAWADGRVQASERSVLGWVAKCLELSAQKLQAINLQSARPRFAEALAHAMDDGQITEGEAEVLDEISKAAGLSLPQFLQEFFRSEGEQFLRGIFAAALEEKHSAIDALDCLTNTASKLGLSRAVVLRAIQPQAVRYIEHALADAKDDDVLTAAEESTLKQLLSTFLLPPEYAQYVTRELSQLRRLTEIRRGKLPSLRAPNGVSIKAGELVHHHGRAEWNRLRLLKSGPRVDTHQGELTITDSRLIFSSPTLSESFRFGSIVGYDVSPGVIEVQRRGKPVQKFVCQGSGRMVSVIFESALRMANQVLVNTDNSRRTRHIPREVRQRVWQRYGGRCAECDATSYLEFDHVVPVAKGGSNSDANVQLLCRGCNARKSDLI